MEDSPRPVSLLLVHPDSDDRDMYAHYLRTNGVTVREVDSTDDALPLIPDADAVVVGVPAAGRIDPLEFIRTVRSIRNDAAIVAVTACVYNGEIAKAERAGADVALMKPCFPETLLQEVRKALDGSDVRLAPAQPRRRVPDRRLQTRGGRRSTDAGV